MELKCSVQNYDWGKIGIQSKVAQLVKLSNPNFIPDEKTPYAELWMGTHPNGPSFLKNENISLQDFIQKDNSVLGNTLIKIYGTNIPFLFKVLSVRKALSIQVHPNKEQAEKLHEKYPKIYKDPNHKPELAIALTPFEALCGFRAIYEIKNYLRSIPELRLVIGESNVKKLISCDDTNFHNELKNSFTSLMLQESEIVAEQLRKLIARLSVLDNTTRHVLNACLLERLHLDYPGDVGCFCIYLFNYITLNPGEAIYLAANEPHAYLSGDCIECMSCSDNVIRAGLTPKMKDVETLIDSLSYICEPGSLKQFKAIDEDEYTELYQPPIQDFAVAKIKIPSGKSYNLITRNTASILIVIDGQAEVSATQALKQGSVLFVPANENISIKVSSISPMLIFQAFANI